MAPWLVTRRPVEVTLTVPSWTPASPSAPPPPPEPPPAAGLSPFSARVLDQLSLTAWLPAALVIANAYLVVGMFLVRPANGGDPSIQNLKDAISALDEKPIGVLLAVIFGVVLVTLLTQSLEFAAIRFLEGYWGGSIVTAAPTWLGVRLQQMTLQSIDRRATRLERRAFAATAPAISEDLESNPDLASATILVGCEKPTAHLETSTEGKKLLLEAQGYYYKGDWLTLSPAHLRHRINSLYLKRKAFPVEESRLMPTRLGNALRTFEDKLVGDTAGSNMRGYLYERLDVIGPSLMRQHTQYRNRLDLYAMMTVVAAVLALMDAWLLPSVLPLPVAVGVASAFLALSYASYRGTIAAAMDYGPILLAMDQASSRGALRR